ncbi:MAG: hypothetical protein F6J86_14680 [Symploca sp. SIO1B1]|nr:hypothetical protein [Symploca sp. SIO1B1]
MAALVVLEELMKNMGVKSKRNRNTVAVSEEGLSIIRGGIATRGWNQSHVADFADISLSTIKRLLRGDFVDRSSLEECLKALELKLDEEYIVKKIDTLEARQRTDDKVAISTIQPGIFMSGTFTEDKRLQIERVLRHLQKLLIGSQINLRDDQGVVTVSGEFSEDKRLHIEATILELKNLFTSIEVTW